MNPTHKRLWILLPLPPALVVLWFITAPAAPAVQRIVAGGQPGTLSYFLSNAAEAYRAPMDSAAHVRILNHAANALGDFWWRVLDPPDTTP